ncbi:unnamed protein product, partial [marine sediment metagenome]
LLLQSCLAVAELREAKGEGVAAKGYLDRLAAAIQLDMQSHAATEMFPWPHEDEPTDLTVDLAYLRRMVGRHLSYGPSIGHWTHTQAAEVAEVVRTGLRRFYTPPVLPDEKYAHEWSFLRPLETLNTVDGEYEYDLPAHFAMLDGPLTYGADESSLSQTVKLVSEHQVRMKRQHTNLTARPTMAALRVQGGDETTWKLVVWPTPDAEYAIHYRCQSNPGLLSSGVAKPAGGMPHAQTVVEACLSAADDFLGVKNSPHLSAFRECLRSS